MTAPKFIDFAPGTVTLGWRFDDVLPIDAVRALEEYLPGCDYRSMLFSPMRTVSIEPFSLACDAIPWIDLIDNTHFVEAAKSLDEICSKVNSHLQYLGVRLPTEDEFEAATGGGLFPWGDVVPKGLPSGDRTAFTRHKEPTASGLRLNYDAYATELVQGYFKLEDGCVSLCGGEPWPIPWLCLSPAFRAPPEMYSQCLPEYFETTLLRPVNVARKL